MKASNLLLLVSLIFGSCQCAEEPLTESLGDPCYTEYDDEVIQISKTSYAYEERNIGICSTGITQKDDKDKIICVGEIQPEPEECNNLDDNCNGDIDEDSTGYPLRRPYYSINNTCNDIGICRYSSQECLEGNWTCIYPEGYGKEICDGSDNDCDGTIDEDTEEEPLFDDGERYVYTAEPDTINIGECRAGYKECVDGFVSIRNMRTPITEVCGNDDDDDCDGITDENENGTTQNDFSLIIDYSGSMHSVIDSVADALCSWSRQGVLQNSRFAVIGIGYAGPGNDREMALLTDFTDSGTACDVIRTANNFQFSGAVEYQLNPAYDVGDSNSSRYVNWNDSNKRVIIFSDEELQQDFASNVQEAIDLIVQQCTENTYSISAFISFDTWDQALWVDLTQRCGGFLDYLTYNPQQMIEQLNYWVGTDC